MNITKNMNIWIVSVTMLIVILSLSQNANGAIKKVCVTDNDKEVQICNREFQEVVKLFRIVEEKNFEKSDHYKVVDWFGDEIIASVYYNN